MMRRLIVPVVALLGLGGCALNPPEPMPSRAAQVRLAPLPPMKLFTSVHTDTPRVANADLARDFLDLTFRLESGRDLPVFSRFEAPIRVSIEGPAPVGMLRDLDALIARLHGEAGLDIARLPVPAEGQEGPVGNVVIQAVSGNDIRGEMPEAACFVVPGIRKLSEFRAARRRNLTDWARQTERTQLAIFVPNDAAPQELRDCLHEELAQSLGPLNDLYRLNDSTFNDDNIQTILTGFDMLVLRIAYAPELHSGMTRAEVSAQLPALLARLNPAGQGIAPHPLAATPRAWIDAMQKALGPAGSPAARLRGATDAVAIAEQMGWNDHRTGFAYYILGRLVQGDDPDAGLRYLRHADRIYAATPQTALHGANTAVQLASHAILRNDPDGALALLAGKADLARAHQNAALLAWIEMLQAEAQDMKGAHRAARATRLDSLGWARYGFGPDWAVRAKLREVAALNPRHAHRYRAQGYIGG